MHSRSRMYVKEIYILLLPNILVIPDICFVYLNQGDALIPTFDINSQLPNANTNAIIVRPISILLLKANLIVIPMSMPIPIQLLYYQCRFILPGNDRRPADIFLPNWAEGRDR